MNHPPKNREPWFTIRRELSPRRRVFLTAVSFLAPLLVWCVVSYVPFIWHPDVKLDMGTTGNTVYTEGDHVGKDYFPTVQAEARERNATLSAAADAGTPQTTSSRNNLKTIRRLEPLAYRAGLVDDDQRGDDTTLYTAWGAIAEGDAQLRRRTRLSDENLAIIDHNWRLLSAASPVYDKSNFPGETLLELVPQGRLANPVYLPAPHEVLTTGIRDWCREPADGKPSMGERLARSIGTVFGGFALAALIAIPLGIMCGCYDVFSRATEPFLDFFRYMPAPAFATLLVAVFGAHNAPKLALVFIGTFPHLALMLSKTTRLLDTSILEAAQTLGARRSTLLRRVVVPGIIPQVYNDLRIALGWAWTWLVIAELIGVKTGLTEVIDTQGDRRNFDRVFPVIILIGIIGFATDQLLSWLRPRFFPYVASAS